MAFTFGTPSPAPPAPAAAGTGATASAPAGNGGGFSFNFGQNSSTTTSAANNTNATFNNNAPAQGGGGGFQFGNTTTAAAPTPAPSSAQGGGGGGIGGFQFGANPAQSGSSATSGGTGNSTTTTTNAAPAASTQGTGAGGGFQFGAANATGASTSGSNNATTNAATSAPSHGVGGFQFGGSSTTTTSAATGTATAQGSGGGGGGFTFGGQASAPGNTTTTTTASSTNVGNGSASTTGTTPAPASTLFASTTTTSTTQAAPAPSSSTQANNNNNAEPVALTVPKYEDLFPWSTLASNVENMMSRKRPPASSSNQARNGTEDELYKYLMEGSLLIRESNTTSSNQNVGKSSLPLSSNSIRDYLRNPDPLSYTAPMHNPQKEQQLRDKLRAEPKIMLHDRVTYVHPPIYNEVIALSDQLRISLVEAIALYGYVSCQTEDIKSVLSQSGSTLYAKGKNAATATLEQYCAPNHGGLANATTSTLFGMPPTDPGNTATQARNVADPTIGDRLWKKNQIDLMTIPLLCREWYFYEMSCLASSCVDMLLNKRLRVLNKCCSDDEQDASSGSNAEDDAKTNSETAAAVQEASNDPVILATDELLLGGDGKKSLVSNLIELVRTYTNRIDTITNEIEQSVTQQTAASSFGTPLTSSGPTNSKKPATMAQITQHMCRFFYLSERRQICELLYQITHDTQLTAEEVRQLLELIQHISNTHLDRLLDPLMDFPLPSPSLVLMRHASPESQQQYLSSQKGATTASRGARAFSSGDGNGPSELSIFGRVATSSCLNILVLAAFCSLDSTACLWDRVQHTTAVFGRGNALMPPLTSGAGASSRHDAVAQSTRLLHVPLFDNVDQWKRQDILGLLRSAYALLLSPFVVSTAAGSTTGAADTFNAYDSFFVDGGVEGAMKSILPSATDFNAIRWIRFGLLPTVTPSAVTLSTARKETSTSSSPSSSMTPFYCTTLARFVNRFAESTTQLKILPSSRDSWISQQVREELEQEQQQGVPNDAAYERPLQPDGLEDILVCIADIIVAYPACATMFWSKISTSSLGVSLSPPMIMLEVDDRIRMSEDSVIPTYINYLSAMALASFSSSVVHMTPMTARAQETSLDDASPSSSSPGASAIFRFLSGQGGRDGLQSLTTRKSALTLDVLIDSVTWYLNEMTNGNNQDPQGNAMYQRNPATDSSRSFMYGHGINSGYDDPNTMSYYAEYQGGSSGFQQNQQAPDTRNTDGPTNETAQNRTREAQTQTHKHIVQLSAILNLLISVCRSCREARRMLLSDASYSSPFAPTTIAATIKNSSSSPSQPPSILNLLFDILMSPADIPVITHGHDVLYDPDPAKIVRDGGVLKGLVFTLLTILVTGGSVQDEGKEDNSDDRASESLNKTCIGMHVWQLMEAYQILPLFALLKSQDINDGNRTSYMSPNVAAMKTPLTFQSLMDEVNDPALFLVRELRNGGSITTQMNGGACFPVTEGFLQLLAALIDNCGCPSWLGSEWRPHCSGVTPYIEYVTYVILPHLIDDGTTTDERSPESSSECGSSAYCLTFRSVAERYRLLFGCLNVIRAVLCRYPVPPTKAFVDAHERRHRERSKYSGPTSSTSRSNTPSLEYEFGSSAIDNEMMEEASYGHGENSDIKRHIETLRVHQCHCEREAKSLGLHPTSLLYHPCLTAASSVTARSSASSPTLEECLLLDAERDFQEESVSTAFGLQPKSPGFVLLSDILGAHELFKYILFALFLPSVEHMKLNNSGDVSSFDLGDLNFLEQEQADELSMNSLFECGVHPKELHPMMAELVISIQKVLTEQQTAASSTFAGRNPFNSFSSPSSTSPASWGEWNDEKQRVYQENASALKDLCLSEANSMGHARTFTMLLTSDEGRRPRNNRFALSSVLRHGDDSSTSSDVLSAPVSTLDVGLWRVLSMQSALLIFNAAAAREKAFFNAVSDVTGATAARGGSAGPLRVLPTLRSIDFSDFFDSATKMRRSSGSRKLLEFRMVSPLHPISSLLHQVAGNKLFRKHMCPPPFLSLATFVGSTTLLDVSWSCDSDISVANYRFASYAMSLLTYLCKKLTPDTAALKIIGPNKRKQAARQVANAFSARLLSKEDDLGAILDASSGEDSESDNIPIDFGVRLSVVNLILASIDTYDQTLAKILLLGVMDSNKNEDEEMDNTSYGSARTEHRSNCLGAIFILLSDDAFLYSRGTSQLASYCLHVLDKICSRGEGVLYHHVMERISNQGLWESLLKRFVTLSPSTSIMLERCMLDHHVMRSLSFVMKGIARELNLSTALNDGAMGEQGARIYPHLSLQEGRKMVMLLLNKARPVLRLLSDLIPVEEQKPNMIPSVLGKEPTLLASSSVTLEEHPGFKRIDVDRLMNALARKFCAQESGYLYKPRGDDDKLESDLESVLVWAYKWNSSVRHSAAGASLAWAFDALLASCFVNYRHFVCGTSCHISEWPSSGTSSPLPPILDFEESIQLLNHILNKLLPPSSEEQLYLSDSSSQILSGVTFLGETRDTLEPCVALSLSISALRLCNAINISFTTGDTDEEDLSFTTVAELGFKSCTLLAWAIVVCFPPSLDRNCWARKRAAILASALSTMLSFIDSAFTREVNRSKDDSSLQKIVLAERDSMHVKEIFKTCVIKLTSLATSPSGGEKAVTKTFPDLQVIPAGPVSSTSTASPFDAVASLALNGVCAIMSFFDARGTWFSQSPSADVSTWIFGGNGFGRQSLVKLLSSIEKTCSDNVSQGPPLDANESTGADVLWTITKICSCPGGAKLLLDHKVTCYLLAASSSIRDQHSKSSQSTYWSNSTPSFLMSDGKQISSMHSTNLPPFLVSSQLHLWRALLGFSPREYRKRVALDFASYVRNLDFIWERQMLLIFSSENNGDLIEILLSCLIMASRACRSDSDWTGSVQSSESTTSYGRGYRNSGNEMNVEVILGPLLPSFDGEVYKVSFHLAGNPLPVENLPPNIIPMGLLEEEIRLSGPVNAPSTIWWSNYSAYEANTTKQSTATDEAFQLPPPPTLSVDVHLAGGGQRDVASKTPWSTTKYKFGILGARTMVSGLRFLSDRAEGHSGLSVHVSPILLSKGICQCALLSRIFDEYINDLEKRLVALPAANIHASRLRNSERAALMLQWDALTTLTPLFAEATEQMLILSSIILQKEGSNHANNINNNALGLYAKCLTIALDFTQVDRLGVGWGPSSAEEKTNKNERIEKLAQSLRKDLQYLRDASVNF